jgi:phosphatidylinositol glycan class V
LTLARNVGLFRYWALPNIPLFVMAAPMLWVMITSSLTVLRGHLQPLLHGRPVPQNSATAEPADNSAVTHNFPELALPQLVLAIAAITSFHVQIVNRLASGYPTWYMIIATWLVDGQTMPDTGIKLRRRSQWVVRGMVTYALAQGMLFANFLPPA